MVYRVEISEAAEAEAEEAYFWMLGQSPEWAARWYRGLLAEVASLAEKPYRFPIARERERFDQEVRRMLYGEGRNKYRVLYAIVERDDPHIRVLHIRHGSRRQPGEERPDDTS